MAPRRKAKPKQIELDTEEPHKTVSTKDCQCEEGKLKFLSTSNKGKKIFYCRQHDKLFSR